MKIVREIFTVTIETKEIEVLDEPLTEHQKRERQEDIASSLLDGIGFPDNVQVTAILVKREVVDK